MRLAWSPTSPHRARSSVDAGLVLAGIDRHRQDDLSLWDALIVEAARAGGCTRLMTEDLNHGQDHDGVTILNPFLS